MFDRRLDEIWVMRYRQGQLSAEDELWTESCYDSEQSVRELFGQLRVIPLHLQDGSDLAVEDDDPAVSDASLLLQIDDELRRLEELVTASKSRPALLRGRLLSVPLARGGRSLPGSVAASATSAAAAAAAAASAAVPERAAPTGRLSCEYEFAGADRTKIVLRFRGPLGVVGVVEVKVEELQSQGPRCLGFKTFVFPRTISEDAAGPVTEKLLELELELERAPTARIVVWATYLNEA